MEELKITQAQKLALVRKDALEMLALPENRFQIGTATYLVETPNGFAKIAITAVKPSTEFDPEFEQSEYFADLAKKAKEKAEKDEIKAKEKAANIAKKEKEKAAKEA